MATAEINKLYNQIETSLQKLYKLDTDLIKAKSSSERIAILEAQLRCIEAIELNAAVRARVVTAYVRSVHGNMLNESKTFRQQIEDYEKKIRSIPRGHPQAESAKDKVKEAREHLNKMKRSEAEATRLMRSARKTASGRGLIGRGFLR